MFYNPVFTLKRQHPCLKKKHRLRQNLFLTTEKILQYKKQCSFFVKGFRNYIYFNISRPNLKKKPYNFFISTAQSHHPQTRKWLLWIPHEPSRIFGIIWWRTKTRIRGTVITLYSYPSVSNTDTYIKMDYIISIGFSSMHILWMIYYSPVSMWKIMDSNAYI